MEKQWPPAAGGALGTLSALTCAAMSKIRYSAPAHRATIEKAHTPTCSTPWTA